MEGQFSKIKKFKGALLALMVAVATSIPVTTGEFKDAHAVRGITPANQNSPRQRPCNRFGRYNVQPAAKPNPFNQGPVQQQFQFNQSPVMQPQFCPNQFNQGQVVHQQFCPNQFNQSPVMQPQFCPNQFNQGQVVHQQFCPNQFNQSPVMQPQFQPNQFQAHQQFRPNQFQVQPQFQPNQFQVQPQFQPNQFQAHQQFRPNQFQVQQQFQVQPQFQPNQFQAHQQFQLNQFQAHQQFQLNQGWVQQPQFCNHMNAVGSLFPSKYQGFHYKLTDIRGSGAFGTVYGATLIHPNGQQSGGYCIKIVQSAYAKVESDDKVSCLTPNQLVRKTVEQIDREIFAMKKASRCNGTNQFIEAFNQHPNTQWGPLNICIVQKDCGRSTLKSLVGRPTVFENIVHIMGQILLITKDIHKQRIVHRDIKPENIMIDNNQIRIVDFGIAKEIDKDNNVLGQTQVGTPFYMAPEVLWGWKHRKNADTWSIGCLFYELLTGKVPFSANTIPQLQSDLYYNHLDWNQFKADVRKNFSDNNIAIGEDQIEAMRIFLSILLNKNSKERPGMTRCIGYFNQLCSHLGINHQI